MLLNAIKSSVTVFFAHTSMLHRYG